VFINLSFNKDTFSEPSKFYYRNVTAVVTGRRVTPTANEGIGAGAKIAIFRNFL